MIDEFLETLRTAIEAGDVTVDFDGQRRASAISPASVIASKRTNIAID